MMAWSAIAWVAAAGIFLFGWIIGRLMRPEASQITFKHGVEVGYEAGLAEGRREFDRRADEMLADVRSA